MLWFLFAFGFSCGYGFNRCESVKICAFVSAAGGVVLFAARFFDNCPCAAFGAIQSPNQRRLAQALTKPPKKVKT